MYNTEAKIVQLTRIYTKSGDRGKTSLGDGTRISKANERICAIGDVDEINAALGIVHAHLKDQQRISKNLLRIQNDLFDVGADLCMPDLEANDCLRLKESQIQWLESEIDILNQNLSPLNSFVLPGGTIISAFLHHARVICRRAERSIVILNQKEPVRPEIIQYINRLSDYFFVLSRHMNNNGANDILWQPGKNQ